MTQHNSITPQTMAIIMIIRELSATEEVVSNATGVVGEDDCEEDEPMVDMSVVPTPVVAGIPVVEPMLVEMVVVTALEIPVVNALDVEPVDPVVRTPVNVKGNISGIKLVPSNETEIFTVSGE